MNRLLCKQKYLAMADGLVSVRRGLLNSASGFSTVDISGMALANQLPCRLLHPPTTIYSPLSIAIML
jgi:hypothetical protein